MYEPSLELFICSGDAVARPDCGYGRCGAWNRVLGCSTKSSVGEKSDAATERWAHAEAEGGVLECECGPVFTVKMF
jgi:hypothetical protein